MSRTTNLFTDGVTIFGDHTFRSNTATFTSEDVDKIIYSVGTSIAAGTTISSINSATSIEMSQGAAATASSVHFTIASPMPVTVKGGKLPINYEPTPSEYYRAFVPRLKVGLSGDNVILGSIETTEPTYNAGPWFTQNGWRFWDDASLKYLAAVMAFSTPYSLTMSASPTVNRTQRFQTKSGTAALLIDTYVPRATALLTVAATTDIDFNLSSSFLGRLSVNTTLTFSNSNPDATAANRPTEFLVCLVNEGTAYTVTWPASIKWPAATAPTQPVAVGGESNSGLYVIRKCHGVTSYDFFGEYVGSYTILDDASTGVFPGGPGSVAVTYGGAGVPIGIQLP